MKHWAEQYIGLPYRRGANGPDEYDCLHFTAKIQREHYGVEMAIANIFNENWSNPKNVKKWLATHDESKRWNEIEKPTDGAIVLMGYNVIPVHIGTWIFGSKVNGVLHCGERLGVVFQSAQSLRRSGWGMVRFFERAK